MKKKDQAFTREFARKLGMFLLRSIHGPKGRIE